MPMLIPLSWFRWTEEQREWMERTYRRMDPATAERFKAMVEGARNRESAQCHPQEPKT